MQFVTVRGGKAKQEKNGGVYMPLNCHYTLHLGYLPHQKTKNKISET